MGSKSEPSGIWGGPRAYRQISENTAQYCLGATGRDADVQPTAGCHRRGGMGVGDSVGDGPRLSPEQETACLLRQINDRENRSGSKRHPGAAESAPSARRGGAFSGSAAVGKLIGAPGGLRAYAGSQARAGVGRASATPVWPSPLGSDCRARLPRLSRRAREGAHAQGTGHAGGCDAPDKAAHEPSRATRPRRWSRSTLSQCAGVACSSWLGPVLSRARVGRKVRQDRPCRPGAEPGSRPRRRVAWTGQREGRAASRCPLDSDAIAAARPAKSAPRR